MAEIPDLGRQEHFGAVVLAAGRSRRMGEPKLVLPWGERTVIGQVAQTLLDAGVQRPVVVTGGSREAVQAALAGMPVVFAYNPDYNQMEMLTSLQTGIRALPPDCRACFVALGDQPGIETGVVRAIMAAFQVSPAPLVIPSYQMRRGHPWLVERALWPELLAMPPEETMRDFLRRHEQEIYYCTVDSPGILLDLDTPQDYREQRPG